MNRRYEHASTVLCEWGDAFQRRVEGQRPASESSPALLCLFENADVRSLHSLRPLGDVEGNPLIFMERLAVDIAANLRKVCEDVFAALVRGDEAETLTVVEPLHVTCAHVHS